MLIGSLLKARRRNPRRSTDVASYYPDWYEPKLLVAATGIFLLSCLDALFTLLLLGMGAVEVNVLMAALLASGARTFVNTKLSITATALIYLVAHSSHGVTAALRVRHVLYAIFSGYCLVFIYQLDLLSRFPAG